MLTPGVSIIVPIYKRERFLHRCVDSIVNQTLRDIEIILVNDGSPDRCPVICDEYAAKDKRITVIHKENGGVSSARNAGMDISRGEFIGFVDPDDYVGPEYFGNMFQGFQKHTDANLVISGFTFVYKTREKKYAYGTYALLDRKEFLSNFLTLQKEGYLISVWNKLYRMQLIDGIRFEVGTHRAEDLLFNLQYFTLCRKFVLIPQSRYFHTLTDESITVNAYRRYIVDNELENSLSRRRKIISLYIKNGISRDMIEKNLLGEPLWFYIVIRNLMARGTPYNFRQQIEQIRKIQQYRGTNTSVINETGITKFVIFFCYYVKSHIMVWVFLKLFLPANKIARFVKNKIYLHRLLF